jgi:hypothetical protein
VCLPPKGGVPHGAAVRGGGKVGTTQASRWVWVSPSVSLPFGHRSTSPCGGGHTSPLAPRPSPLATLAIQHGAPGSLVGTATGAA